MPLRMFVIRGKRSTTCTLTGVWKFISTLLDDSGEFKTSVEDAPEDVVDAAEELEWEVEPERGLDCRSPWWNCHGWGVALYGWGKEGFLDMESTPGEGLWRWLKEQRILEYHINLVDKVVVGFPIFKGVLWVKCYQTSPRPQRNCSWRKCQCSQLHCCLTLRNRHDNPNLQQTAPIRVHLSVEAKALHQQKD